jgi:hypothetical protein
MNRSMPIFRACLASLCLAFVVLAFSGCGGSTVPTKIHEGGGTIPEIVDQPEPGEAKKASTKKK